MISQFIFLIVGILIGLGIAWILGWNIDLTEL